MASPQKTVLMTSYISLSMMIPSVFEKDLPNNKSKASNVPDSHG